MQLIGGITLPALLGRNRGALLSLDLSLYRSTFLSRNIAALFLWNLFTALTGNILTDLSRNRPDNYDTRWKMIKNNRIMDTCTPVVVHQHTVAEVPLDTVVQGFDYKLLCWLFDNFVWEPVDIEWREPDGTRCAAPAGKLLLALRYNLAWWLFYNLPVSAIIVLLQLITDTDMQHCSIVCSASRDLTQCINSTYLQ